MQCDEYDLCIECCVGCLVDWLVVGLVGWLATLPGSILIGLHLRKMQIKAVVVCKEVKKQSCGMRTEVGSV